MKKLLLIWFSLVVISELAAHSYDYTDMSTWKESKIWKGLTDSTLVFQCLPDSLTIGTDTVKYITDNSIERQRKNEERLDSIWRKEDIWNKGVAKITGEPVKDLSTIEPPRWAVWDYDLTKYYVSQMKYPEELLEKKYNRLLRSDVYHRYYGNATKYQYLDNHTKNLWNKRIKREKWHQIS